MNNSLKSISSVILGATLLASSAFAIPNPGSAKPDHENWTAPQPTEVVSPSSLVRMRATPSAFVWSSMNSACPVRSSS